MSTYDDLIKDENYNKLLNLIPEKERKELEDEIKELMKKFDISLEAFTEATEKDNDG